MHRRLILLNCLVMLIATEQLAKDEQTIGRNQTRLPIYRGIFYSRKQRMFYVFADQFYLRTSDDLVERRFQVDQHGQSAEQYEFENAPPAGNSTVVQLVQTVGDACYLTMTNRTFLFDDRPKLAELERRNDGHSLSLQSCLRNCAGQILQIGEHLICFLAKNYYHLCDLNKPGNSKMALRQISDLLPAVYGDEEELKFIFNYRDDQHVLMTKSNLFVFSGERVAVDEKKSNSPIFDLSGLVKLRNCLFGDCQNEADGTVKFARETVECTETNSGNLSRGAFVRSNCFVTNRKSLDLLGKSRVPLLIALKVLLIVLACSILVLVGILSARMAKNKKKKQIRQVQARANQARANQETLVKVKEMFQKKIGKASLKRVMAISEGEKKIAKVITAKRKIKCEPVDLVARRRFSKKMGRSTKLARSMKAARPMKTAKSMAAPSIKMTVPKRMRIVNEIEIMKVENKVEFKSIRTRILGSGTQAFSDYLKTTADEIQVISKQQPSAGQPKLVKVDLKQSVQLNESPAAPGISAIKVKSGEVLYKIVEIKAQSKQKPPPDEPFSCIFK